MKLQFDPNFIYWLSNWEHVFEWDNGNTYKNEKHGVTHSQIEKIFDSPIYVAGRILEKVTEPRWLLLGEINKKGWALIVTLRGRKIRVISCRRQRKGEAKFYEDFKKTIEEPENYF